MQELAEVEGFPDDAKIVHIAAGDFHSAAVSGCQSSEACLSVMAFV